MTIHMLQSQKLRKIEICVKKSSAVEMFLLKKFWNIVIVIDESSDVAIADVQENIKSSSRKVVFLLL